MVMTQTKNCSFKGLLLISFGLSHFYDHGIFENRYQNYSFTSPMVSLMICTCSVSKCGGNWNTTSSSISSSGID